MSNCDNNGTKNEQENLFNGDNPFVGTWKSNARDDGEQAKLLFLDIAIEMYWRSKTMPEYSKYPESPNSHYLYN
jgi:hypothetical protein